MADLHSGHAIGGWETGYCLSFSLFGVLYRGGETLSILPSWSGLIWYQFSLCEFR